MDEHGCGLSSLLRPSMPASSPRQPSLPRSTPAASSSRPSSPPASQPNSTPGASSPRPSKAPSSPPASTRHSTRARQPEPSSGFTLAASPPPASTRPASPRSSKAPASPRPSPRSSKASASPRSSKAPASPRSSKAPASRASPRPSKPPASPRPSTPPASSHPPASSQPSLTPTASPQPSFTRPSKPPASPRPSKPPSTPAASSQPDSSPRRTLPCPGARQPRRPPPGGSLRAQGSPSSRKALAKRPAHRSASPPSPLQVQVHGCLGEDATSIFLLKIKIVGNRAKARQDVQCLTDEMVVDSDLINFKDLVDSIVDKFPPRYLEVAHLQYYDEVDKTFPEIKSDQELMVMFSKYSLKKVVIMFITYHAPSDPYEPITKWDFSDDEHPHNEIGGGQPDNNHNDDDDYLRNPLPQNEHVGVNEESLYLDIERPSESCNAALQVVPFCAEKEKNVSENEEEDDNDVEEDEEAVEDQPYMETNEAPTYDYDLDDPPMTVGSTYPSMEVFRLAMCQYAIKHQFEFDTAKSGPKRFRAYCSRRVHDNCPWWLFASSGKGSTTVTVKKHPCAHACSSSRRKKKIKNATKHWIAEKVKDFLIQEPNLGAKALQKKIKEHQKVKVNYKRIYMGKELARTQIFGDWNKSFNNLYNFKEQVKNCCPGSIVHIDHHTINGKIRFRRFFCAFKPCIDGFLSGCRPYLALDSTFLIGKFKGQLASATAVDGHNWLYPVCFGVFDSETTDNWVWFMEQLKEAIGSRTGLTISTDAGQALKAGVEQVFPGAEHRECMFHLVNNFKKKYSGQVFNDHLWAAAYSWNSYMFEKHWSIMEKAKPAATNYLRQNHKKLWTRSQFSTISKVDYVTNNLAESFNKWIKQYKALNLDDLVDKLRQLIMSKWNQRRKISKKFDGLILPHIIKDLNEKSRELNLEVEECSEEVAEVTAMGGTGFRFVVNLHDRTCSCRQWQVTGIPCDHALAFITSLDNEPIEKYVDLYYSTEKFRVAYSQLIPAMPDKTQWAQSTHGFFMHPPLLKAVAGRPKTERFQGTSDKKKKKGQHQCPICMDYGHHWHSCKRGRPEDIAAMKAIKGPPKKRARNTKSAQSSIIPLQGDAPTTSMSFPPSQTLELTSSKRSNCAKSTSQTSISQSLEVSSRKKGKLNNSNSGASKRSRSDSNQPEPLSIDEPTQDEPINCKPKKKKKVVRKVQLESPSMCTRSKQQDKAASPAMSTRSKRRLSL